MDGRARERAQRLGAQPPGLEPGDDPLQPEHRGWRAVDLDHQHVAGARRAPEEAVGGGQAQRAPSPASRLRCAPAPADRPSARRAAAGSRSRGAAPARAPASAAPRGCAPSAAGPEPGPTSGSSSSPSECNVAIVAREGTPPSSAKETWMPRPASSVATSVTSPAGACTIMPTSRWLVLHVGERVDVQELFATAVTSSVDIIHAPSPAAARPGWRTPPAAAASAGSGARGDGASSTTSTAAAVLRPRVAGLAAASCPAPSREARPHVLAQLVGVVGQPQEIERRPSRACSAARGRRAARRRRPGVPAASPPGR